MTWGSVVAAAQPWILWLIYLPALVILLLPKRERPVLANGSQTGPGPTPVSAE